MIVACNGHIKKFFVASWISCLDSSVPMLMNKFMCQGFFFCPHKPHPKGNDYHTIFCGEIGIMYDWDII